MSAQAAACWCRTSGMMGSTIAATGCDPLPQSNKRTIHYVIYSSHQSWPVFAAVLAKAMPGKACFCAPSNEPILWPI